MDKLPVVVDTNILVSSIFWSGNPYKIIQKGINQEILVFSSKDILIELRRALKRDFKVSDKEIKDIINSFVLFLHMVEPKEKINHIKEDPKDNIILECAMATNAKFIVSGYRHLLKLKEYRKTKIISAREFLNL